MQNDFVYHIPYSVLFADEKALSCRSKLIFAYVSSLAHKGGECFARSMQGRQDCHARVTSSSYRGDRTDTHINNININKNTYSNNSKSPNTLSKPFEYPKDEEIQKRIDKRLKYIQGFKANNKTFNCECCNHEINSESVNDETGIYHCDNCNYGIRIPIPKL